MENFIGNIGAVFIIAAAAVVIAEFFLEINVIKDKNVLKKYVNVSLMTILVGGAYIAIITFMYNNMKERANFFEFEKLFDFFDMEKLHNACEKPTLSGLFGGMTMPFYPIAVHLAGKLVFKKYVLIEGFFSFAPACVSACMLYSMIGKKADKENTTDAMLVIASLPYVFMIFAPTYISMTLMFIVCSAYALSKESKKGFIIMSVLACLVSKWGIAAFLLLFLEKHTSQILDGFEKVILKNKIALRIIISLFMIFNGMVIFCLIRGI